MGLAASELSVRFEALTSDIAEKLASGEPIEVAGQVALQNFLLQPEVSHRELLAWLAATKKLPEQEDVHASFGEPPITVVNREEFYIQVLFWRDGTTRVHQHAFSGAFGVLIGSSIHVEYTFETHTRASEGFRTGRLSHASTEYLQRGACRAILSGDQFIHSVFHLDAPTVSIVVRNHGDRDATTQLAYRPTIAVDTFATSQEHQRRVQLLALVCDEDEHTADAIVCSMIEQSSPAECYLLLEHLTKHRGRVGAVKRLISHAQEIHGEAAASFTESLRDAIREENIVARRKAIRAPSHRSILALLLTVPNRLELLTVVAAMTPKRDPVDVLLGALQEIRELPVAPDWGPNALGIALDSETLAFLERVLRGATVDEAALSATDAVHGQMLALQLPMSSILQPLFR